MSAIVCTVPIEVTAEPYCLPHLHPPFPGCVQAGGLGLNLCAADTVIIFDGDWNPHADAQATDRAHRHGQVKPVVVYRLVTAQSVELHMVKTADSKRSLEKLVLQVCCWRAAGLWW
jgi:hypothetical protein